MKAKFEEWDTELQARKELGELFKEIQQQSIINGTDKLTLDEINEIIKECRQDTYKKGD